MDLPKRKPNRIPHFDYSSPGAYFITICTLNEHPLLGTIVGGGALDAPYVRLTTAGHTVRRYIESGNQIPDITVDKYVIMPNHIHLILLVTDSLSRNSTGPSLPANAVIPHFVSTLERFCHRDAGKVLFQRSYHDHVIRNEAGYLKIWQYTDSNPAKWQEDCFYCPSCNNP